MTLEPSKGHEMSVKETIDIEDLLRWAYQRQKIDRVSQANASKRLGPARLKAGGASAMIYGCPIDNPASAMQFSATAPVDAEIIHEAVLRLDQMFIDIEGGIWTRERIERIGGAVVQDKAKRFWLDIAGERSPLECAWLGALVIVHAKNGARPEWCEGWRDAGAAVAGDRAPRDQRGRARKGQREFTGEDVAFYRAEYQCWHAALGLLAAELAGILREFEPLGPAAPREPWRVERKGQGFLPTPSRENLEVISTR